MDYLRRQIAEAVGERRALILMADSESRGLSPDEFKRLAEIDLSIRMLSISMAEIEQRLPDRDPDFRLVSSETYQLFKERARFTAQIQAQYGTWLIATLAAVHLGAAYMTGISDISISDKSYAVRWFVIGIALDLASGFCAWLNWSLLFSVFEDWLDASMLTDRTKWPKAGKGTRADAITATSYLAIIFGMASLGALLIGAKAATGGV